MIITDFIVILFPPLCNGRTWLRVLVRGRMKRRRKAHVAKRKWREQGDSSARGELEINLDSKGELTYRDDEDDKG